MAWEELGDVQKAIKDYGIAIKLNPEDPYSYFNRGSLKIDLKDYKNAIIDLSKAIELDPGNKDAFALRGIAYEEIDDMDSACEDWKSSSELGDAEADEWYRDQCIFVGVHSGGIEDSLI